MMKRRAIAAILLVILTILLLTGCGSRQEPNKNTDEIPEPVASAAVDPADTEEKTEEEVQAEPSQTNVMVVVFSGTGHTRRIAQVMADGLGVELTELLPAEPYTDEDLNYNDSGTRATVEQNDPTSRPEIAETIEGLEDCGVLFLGYPIWWGREPRILDTFADSYDLSGITIVPFCTSGSSGIGTSVRNLSELEPDAIWMDGKGFETNASDEDINAWAAEMLAAVKTQGDDHYE